MFKRVLRLRHRRTLIFWLLALVVILPLTVFFMLPAGFGGRSSPGPGGKAGMLFGRPVPWEAFQEEYRFVRSGLEARFGDMPQGVEPLLYQQTWDRLILKAEARRRVRVSDEEVARAIHTQPRFQQHGQFQPQLYYRYIRSLGFSPQAFEERARDDLRIQQLVETVRAQVQLSEEDLKAAYAQEHDRLAAAFLSVDPTAFERQARRELTQERLREYYAAHHETFRRSPQRVFEYIGLSHDAAIQQQPPITREELQALYERLGQEFQREDGTVPPLAELADVLRSRLLERRAQQHLTILTLDLEEDVERGLRFAEIALSRGLRAERIGPLDPLSPPPPHGPPGLALWEAFQVPVGGLSRVFTSPSGVFLLMAVEEIPSRLPPFEEVRTEVEQHVVQARAREAALAKARTLREALLGQVQAGRSFDEACKRAGLSPIRPAPFTRQGPGEGLEDLAAVTEAVFRLTSGEPSEVLETPKRFVIAVVEERLPFDEAQFASNHERFRQTLLAATQQERVAAWLTRLRERARLTSYLDESR